MIEDTGFGFICDETDIEFVSVEEMNEYKQENPDNYYAIKRLSASYI